MWPYFLVFFVVTAISAIAEKNIEKNKNKLGIILLIFSAVILAVFAGLRTVDLGYDTKMYGVNAFNIANKLNFSQYLNYVHASGMEDGFLLYLYAFNFIWNNINFVLFGLQFIVSISFIVFAYNYRKNCSISLSMLIYCCTLYAFSFNILRQSIAVAFGLFMVIAIEKNKKFLTVLCIILGGLFHNSAVLMIIVPIIILFNDSKKFKASNKKALNFFLILGLLVAIGIYPIIVKQAVNLGFISGKYLHYIDADSTAYRSTINIEWSQLITKTFTLLLCIFYYLNINIPKEEKDKNLKWLIMLIMDYAVLFVSFKSANTDRISWYVYYPALYAFVPQTIKIFENDKLNRVCGYVIIGGIFVAYIFEKLYTNQYNINPYKWVL